MFFFSLLDKTKKGDYTLDKEIGLTRGTVAAWRCGKYKPSFDALEKMRDYFGLSIGELLGEITTDLKHLYPPNLLRVIENWAHLDETEQTFVARQVDLLLNKKSLSNKKGQHG